MITMTFVIKKKGAYKFLRFLEVGCILLKKSFLHFRMSQFKVYMISHPVAYSHVTEETYADLLSDISIKWIKVYSCIPYFTEYPVVLLWIKTTI